MNPGITEEAKSITVQTVDALKSTPVLLMILLFNLIWLAFVTYSTIKTGERWERVVTTALQTCKPTLQKEGWKLEDFEEHVVKLPPQLRRDASKPEQIPDLSPPPKL